MCGTRPRSGVSPTLNVLLDRKTILNSDAIDMHMSENESRDISLSVRHNHEIHLKWPTRSKVGHVLFSFRACLKVSCRYESIIKRR